VIQAEIARKNKHALGPAQLPVLGVSDRDISKTCGGTTNTGCNKGSHIVVNADRTPAAISSTIVHERQHEIGATRKARSEECADLRAARYVSSMAWSTQVSATSGHLPAETSAPMTGGCGFKP
jgi:hypothetical protein